LIILYQRIWIGPAIESIPKTLNYQTKNQIGIQAIEIAESIYSNFITQQAIRLVIRNSTLPNHQQEEALIM
jgi:hypothetical protein